MQHEPSARVAVLGCGPRAQRAVLPVLRHTGCDLVAVSDPHILQLQTAQRYFGARRSYRDFQEMIDKEILDFVIIAESPEAHVSARHALHTGLPALLATSEGLDATTGPELATMSSELDVPVGMLSWPRFDSATAAALQAANDGIVGHPLSISLRAIRTMHDRDVRHRVVNGFLTVLDLVSRFAGELRPLAVNRFESEGVLRCGGSTTNHQDAAVTIELIALEQSRTERWTLDILGTHGRVSLNGNGTVETERWPEVHPVTAGPAPRRSEMQIYSTNNRVELAFAAGIEAFADSLFRHNTYAAPLGDMGPAFDLAEQLAAPKVGVRPASAG